MMGGLQSDGGIGGRFCCPPCVIKQLKPFQNGRRMREEGQQGCSIPRLLDKFGI